MGCAAVLATPEATTALVLTQDRHGPRTEQARPEGRPTLGNEAPNALLLLVDTTGRTDQTGADHEPLASRVLQVEKGPSAATQIAASYFFKSETWGGNEKREVVILTACLARDTIEPVCYFVHRLPSHAQA